MSNGLTFIPRSLTKKKLPVINRVNAKSQQASPAPHTNAPSESAKEKVKTIQPQHLQQRYQDYATFLELALSNHSIWSNPELRKHLESSSDGYVPLDELMSDCLFPDAPEPASIIRSLREYASGTLDVRMKVVEPDQGEWWYGSNQQRGNSSSTSSLSGYEVRRKDWEFAKSVAGEAMTRQYWHDRTIYVENLPNQYRTKASIARLIQSLLITSEGDSSEKNQEGRTGGMVQSVQFPARFNAPPEEVPKCKGFAFVVLNSLEVADRLLREWPWHPPAPPAQPLTKADGAPHPPQEDEDSMEQDVEGQQSVDINERELMTNALRRNRFRTLSRTAWDKLKEEYLAHQSHMLELCRQPIPLTESLSPPPDDRRPLKRKAMSPVPSYTPIELDSSMASNTANYPQNCLVFVRNVHPETNKTTLRNLFTRVITSSASDSKSSSTTNSGGLDYVDYQKGMDSCYLRLISPSKATTLSTYFTTHSILQLHGTDESGKEAEEMDEDMRKEASLLPMAVEIVTGKREEIYWERVPEKIRNLALSKATAGGNEGGPEEEREKGRKHKRRRN